MTDSHFLCWEAQHLTYFTPMAFYTASSSKNIRKAGVLLFSGDLAWISMKKVESSAGSPCQEQPQLRLAKWLFIT